jgi:hypothetical protein
MNKQTCVFLLSAIGFLLLSCDRKPFVEHKLKFEKVADNCTEQQAYFRMNSNFGGERYEFEKCLPADFNENQLTSERRGDTVVVKFKNAAAVAGNKVYHITLDIDSYPKYSVLMIDNDTYSISPTEK